MRPFSLPVEYWPVVHKSERAPVRPQPVLELELPRPLPRAPRAQPREDEGRGVTVIDVWGD